MLWFMTLMIFLSIGGSLCDPDDDDHTECSSSEREEQCDRSLLPDDFPETAEELEKSCRNLQTFISCVRDAKVECGDETHLDFIQKYLDYLKSLCNKDNPHFSVISKNIECIAQNARMLEHSCSDILSDENREKLHEHLAPYEGENSTQEVIKCLYFQLDISCYSVTLGHQCGSDVKNAIEPIVMNLYNHPVVCGDMQEDVEKLKEVFEALLVAELNLKKKLNRRK